MPKSKFFRVAVEGPTIDGRTIDAKELQEMADGYNPLTYTARVNMEHIRGITAEPPFQALGDVLALKTQDVELTIGGKAEKRLALFAEIDALPQLLAINKKGQKLFSSIEIQPNFANTGKAYLAGRAVTDSPASLGTEMLQFRTKMGAEKASSPLALDPTHTFTTALETEIELVEDAAVNADPTGFFASMKAALDKFTGVAPAAAVAPVVPPAAAAGETAPAADAAGLIALSGIVGQLATTVQQHMATSATDAAALRTDLAALKTTLEATPASGFTPRPAATGGTNSARTDC